MNGFTLFQEIPCSDIVQVLSDLDIPMSLIAVESDGKDGLKVWIANEAIDWPHYRLECEYRLKDDIKRPSLPRLARASTKSTATKSRRGLTTEASA